MINNAHVFAYGKQMAIIDQEYRLLLILIFLLLIRDDQSIISGKIAPCYNNGEKVVKSLKFTFF